MSSMAVFSVSLCDTDSVFQVVSALIATAVHLSIAKSFLTQSAASKNGVFCSFLIAAFCLLRPDPNKEHPPKYLWVALASTKQIFPAGKGDW